MKYQEYIGWEGVENWGILPSDFLTRLKIPEGEIFFPWEIFPPTVQEIYQILGRTHVVHHNPNNHQE